MPAPRGGKPLKVKVVRRKGRRKDKDVIDKRATSDVNEMNRLGTAVFRQRKENRPGLVSAAKTAGHRAKRKPR